MRAATLISGIIMMAVSRAGAIQLSPETVKAWEDYIQVADHQMQSRLHGERPFLWVDETPDRRLALGYGELLVEPLAGRGLKSVTQGLIHEWIGAAFLPNATLDSLLSVFDNYDEYKTVYKPFVTGSKLLGCSSRESEFSMTWRRRVLFVNAAIEGRYRTQHGLVDAHRGYSVASTTQVVEIANYGGRNEYRFATDTGHGYVWRLHSITRYAESDGGVYLEVEARALTRSIPASLHWLIDPIVRRLSMNSMTTMLRQTRDAVAAMRPQPASVAVPASRCFSGRPDKSEPSPSKK
jgi:hypothetical protein